MSSMVKVKVFYDGTYKIEKAKENALVQHSYISENGEFGEMYVCLKEEVEEYKNKLINDIVNINKKKIKRLKESNKILIDLLSENTVLK